MTLEHDIKAMIIHVLIPWNIVTLFCQIVPLCVCLRFNSSDDDNYAAADDDDEANSHAISHDEGGRE